MAIMLGASSKRGTLTVSSLRNIVRAGVAAIVLLGAAGPSWADASIYDARILERMKFSPQQLAKVKQILAASDREMLAIFAKYGIDPDEKPNFEKLKRAGNELQAMEAREKRQMKRILTPDQYKQYSALLAETSARVIKATRTR